MKQEKHYLSKSTYIRGLQCIKSLYLYKKRYFLKDPLPPEQRAKFNRGNEVGKLAHQLFPGGIDLSPKTPFQYPKSVTDTAEAISNPDINVIYEAAFQYERVLAAMDILIRGESGWIAYEVKSSLAISDTYREDIALQYYVISSSGLELEDIRLLHLNPDYRKAGELDLDQLFVSESLLDFAKGRRHSVAQAIQDLQKVKEMQSSPKVPIGPQCHHPYPCDFIGHCWKNVPEKSILNLSLLPEDKRFSLFHDAVELDDVRPHFGEMNEVQLAQLEAVKTGRSYFNKEKLGQKLGEVNNNKAYLSYILTKPAVPLFEDHNPFQEILVGFEVNTPEGETIQRMFDLNESQPDIILTNLFREASNFETIIVEDQKHFISYLQQAGELYPELKPRLKDLEDKLFGITDLVYQGVIFPSHVGTNIGLSTIAAGFGNQTLQDHKINNMRLAGEIYRQIFLSESTIKGFSTEDIGSFLRYHNLGLFESMKAYRNL